MTGNSGTEGRKGEIRAVWARICEHTEALRRITGELQDLNETPPSADLLERLSDHATGVREAATDLEAIGQGLAAGERLT